MYENLITNLRNCAETNSLSRYKRELMKQASDAIEELSRIERDFRQYISDQVKREKGVYACCYCKNRESANVYEPGCIHEKCDGVSGWQYGTPPKEETI